MLAKKTASLMALAENFGKEFSAELLEIWLGLLEQYTARQVAMAVRDVIESYEYKTLPPFAMLKKSLDRAAGVIAPEKAARILADAAWAKLLEDIARLGVYKGPPAMDAATEHALRCLGGWQMACNWSTEQLDWKRREFVRMWQNAREHPEFLEICGQALLPGSAEKRLALLSNAESGEESA